MTNRPPGHPHHIPKTDFGVDLHDEFEPIRLWAQEKGIFEKGSTQSQFIKLVEEVGELGKAIIEDDKKNIKDSLGDIVVVLVSLSHLSGNQLEYCIAAAYKEIKNRKGEMAASGTFVREPSEEEIQKYLDKNNLVIIPKLPNERDYI